MLWGNAFKIESKYFISVSYSYARDRNRMKVESKKFTQSKVLPDIQYHKNSQRV